MLTLTIHTDSLDKVRVRLALALRQLAVLIEKSPACEGEVKNEAGDVIGAWMLVPTDDAAAVQLQLQGQADALRELVARCDGDEGVREDGSNIDTRRAHAAMDPPEGE